MHNSWAPCYDPGSLPADNIPHGASAYGEGHHHLKDSIMHIGTRLTTRYIAAIRWFIPHEVRADAATLTRAQNVINAVVMAALSGPLYAYIYRALGYGAAARVILTCCLGMFAAPFLMRATKSIVVGREVFLCAVFFNFSWLTYAMGGVSAPTAGWMVIPPMVAIFLGGFATGMFWLCLTCAAIVFIYALPLLGIPLPAHPIQDMELLYVLCDVGLYIVIVLFALLLELTRTHGVVKLQHALDFMHDAAVRDQLTGGHKRSHTMRLLKDEQENAAAKGTTFSLCLLEIDHFRRINAAHGQAAGDLVLQEVASCVRQQLGANDAFGRYGAAQLLLILPAATQEEALLLAERTRQRVRQLRFARSAPELDVSVSIGVAELRPGESIGQTVARADEALYQASGARNRVAAYGQPPEPGAPVGYGAAPDLFDSTRIDALTGLLSRRVLRDRLGHAMARALRNGRPVGLMLLNVNKLKDINDAFGIAGGDAVLAQAAAQVRACLHVADTVVRWSGDQFIVILEDQDSAAETQQVAERILDRFAFPLAVGERECFVSLSIGIALFPAPACDMDALIERAGLAMTRARNWGGNNVQVYVLDAVPAPDQRLTLKNDLREALYAHQLLLAYRPRVDLGTGTIVGVEALILWAHPEYGRLEAARFMPLAEETGLVVPIGEWALRSACRQNAAWRAAGLPPVRTAVSLSARQLAHPGMAESILAIVKETGIDPRCLDLQVTEAALAGKLPLHEVVLERLRRAGVRVCIDGFGLGTASLRFLATLPADTIKLDSSFVGRLGQPERDERAWALAESIIHLAHRLRLSVVAEAVDTRAQLAELGEMGCDAAQGEALGRAAGADEIAQLLEWPSAMPLAACPT
jgi:diguanylate cyclase (GGDEF)-like protein